MTLPTFPIAATTLTLPGPAGALEVAVDPPEAEVAARPVVAVLCHPLSTEGGSMHNKVVTMAARSLRELGATTVRFNFRGVGQSEGVFDHGEGELDDLRAVVAWVRAVRPDHALWLGGFSFGAYVSLRGAMELRPSMLVSIAPPAGRWAFERIATPTMPWLVIQGEEDEIVDPQAVYDWLQRIGADAEVVRMPETSHFFHRKLMDLRGAIKHGVQRHLPPTPEPASAP
jgi:alpha/beta superfamily hydrolase